MLISITAFDAECRFPATTFFLYNRISLCEIGYNSAIVSGRHFSRSQSDLPDELLCRRSSFRQGKQIRLADGQMWTFPAPPQEAEWTFPAPPQESEWKAIPFGAEYTGIIQAILESEDISERRLGELSLTIFLLGHNYHLSPADYERLLGTSAGSLDSKNWQLAVQQFTHEHIHSFVRASQVSLTAQRAAARGGRISRLLAQATGSPAVTLVFLGIPERMTSSRHPESSVGQGTWPPHALPPDPAGS